MDRLGEAYGGPEDADSPASILGPAHGVIDLPEFQHMWLVLTGHLRVTGREGVPAVVEGGSGVFWDRDEPWTVEAIDGDVRYLDVEGPVLTIAHFER